MPPYNIISPLAYCLPLLVELLDNHHGPNFSFLDHPPLLLYFNLLDHPHLLLSYTTPLTFIFPFSTPQSFKIPFVLLIELRWPFVFWSNAWTLPFVFIKASDKCAICNVMCTIKFITLVVFIRFGEVMTDHLTIVIIIIL